MLGDSKLKLFIRIYFLFIIIIRFIIIIIILGITVLSFMYFMFVEIFIRLVEYITKTTSRETFLLFGLRIFMNRIVFNFL